MLMPGGVTRYISRSPFRVPHLIVKSAEGKAPSLFAPSCLQGDYKVRRERSSRMMGRGSRPIIGKGPSLPESSVLDVKNASAATAVYKSIALSGGLDQAKGQRHAADLACASLDLGHSVAASPLT